MYTVVIYAYSLSKKKLKIAAPCFSSSLQCHRNLKMHAEDEWTQSDSALGEQWNMKDINTTRAHWVIAKRELPPVCSCLVLHPPTHTHVLPVWLPFIDLETSDAYKYSDQHIWLSIFQCVIVTESICTFKAFSVAQIHPVNYSKNDGI